MATAYCGGNVPGRDGGLSMNAMVRMARSKRRPAAVARQVDEQSGGYIGADTSPGSGTTFSILLPRVFDAQEPLPAPSPPVS